jgi:hypothetical protein
VRAFLGGVPGRVRYDNLRSAVQRVLRGGRRVEQDGFVALRSHYLYGSFFCEPGSDGAHEKGASRARSGRFRRNNPSPCPRSPASLS